MVSGGLSWGRFGGLLGVGCWCASPLCVFVVVLCRCMPPSSESRTTVFRCSCEGRVWFTRARCCLSYCFLASSSFPFVVLSMHACFVYLLSLSFVFVKRKCFVLLFFTCIIFFFLFLCFSSSSSFSFVLDFVSRCSLLFARCCCIQPPKIQKSKEAKLIAAQSSSKGKGKKKVILRRLLSSSE